MRVNWWRMVVSCCGVARRHRVAGPGGESMSGEGLGEDGGQRVPPGPVEGGEVAVDGAQHVAFGPGAASNDALVMLKSVDGL
jgi:hypothetical protein